MQSHQQNAGVADADELQKIESELAAEEARHNAVSGRRDDLMQRRAAALADKQRCGERCAVLFLLLVSFFVSNESSNNLQLK